MKNILNRKIHKTKEIFIVGIYKILIIAGFFN